MLVASDDARALVAAQAAFTADEFQRGGDPRAQAHEGWDDRYLESISRLHATRACRIYFSHDDRIVTPAGIEH